MRTHWPIGSFSRHGGPSEELLDGNVALQLALMFSKEVAAHYD
jgi:hypothetical protein